MNTHKKGINAQNECKKFLLNKGWKFLWFIHHTRFSKDIVIDEAKFDGFGIDNNNKVVFIQVKCNRFPTLKPYKDFSNNYKLKVLLAMKPDYKEWKFKETD